jgi:hypothetical protein
VELVKGIQQMKWLMAHWKREKRGQSLVELTLIFTILLTLLTGVVEFGNLLNQYITLVDAAREGARFGSSDDPFIRTTNPFGLNANFFTNIDQIVEGSFNADGTRAFNAKGALAPIKLRPEMGDDVVISFFSIYNGTLTRFPTSKPLGWSYYATQGFTGRSSQFTTAQMQTMVEQGTASAPDTGMVVVEIFYNYSQILHFWGFVGIPDPISVHAYAIMPLTAGEPTPIP